MVKFAVNSDSMNGRRRRRSVSMYVWIVRFSASYLAVRDLSFSY